MFSLSDYKHAYRKVWPGLSTRLGAGRGILEDCLVGYGYFSPVGPRPYAFQSAILLVKPGHSRILHNMTLYPNGLSCVGPDQRMSDYTQALMLESKHKVSDRHYEGKAANFQEQASAGGCS